MCLSMTLFIIILLVVFLVLLLLKGLDNRLETTYYNISSPKIPKSFDNFKIVHISDYHSDPISGLVSEIETEAPDIIVMTGDMTDDKKKSYLPSLELVKKLCKIAPCYMVSGNHDTWHRDYKKFVSACRDEGALYLQNQTVEIERNNEKILISGMEDAFTKVRLKQKIDEYIKFFSPSDNYQILLFHRANALDYIKDFGFDLILSGHLHGGHIRLPFIGGLVSPLSSAGICGKIFFPKYDAGLYTNNQTTMIVNRGTGNPVPVPRLFNRPEIGVITLNSASE